MMAGTGREEDKVKFMAHPNTGGPAFPRVATIWNDEQDGMSLRAWLAGMAMQGFLCGSLLDRDPELVALASCKQADALIAELEKDK